MSEINDEPFGIPEEWTKEQALEELKKFGEKFPHTRAAIRDITPEEMGSLLFIATGPDVLIQAMHYKDEALDLSTIPNIFPSNEPGKVIAGFPDSLIRKMIEKVEKDYADEYQDYMWQKALGYLMETVVEMIDSGKVKPLRVEDIL